MSRVEYDFTSLGSISKTEDGFIDIKYDESELTGFADSYIRILFEPGKKDVVTIRRKSFYDTWFTLEAGKRISIDQGQGQAESGYYAGSVMTVKATELVNNMGPGGGEMQMVYITETDGIPAEMISQTIKAEAAGE